jgi:hypothetical protein
MKPNTFTVARPLAPEEIDAGMYVAVLYEHESLMPIYQADTLLELQSMEMVRWRDTPERARSFRVISVCVPFVLVERPSGKHVTLDIRVTSLARLSDAFGSESFKRLKPKRKPRGGKRDKDSDSDNPSRSWKRPWRRGQE